MHLSPQLSTDLLEHFKNKKNSKNNEKKKKIKK
jgi:hypothetical protein